MVRCAFLADDHEIVRAGGGKKRIEVEVRMGEGSGGRQGILAKEAVRTKIFLLRSRSALLDIKHRS